MWFLLFATGAVALHFAGVPVTRRLPVPPDPGLLLAGWFLVAALVRGLVMRARLRAFERQARRLARRAEDRGQRSPMTELGVGVGLGAFQAVGGDVAGATISLLAALLRGASRRVGGPPAAAPPQRERRRAARRERVRALASIVGVGLVCAGLAWRPVVGPRVKRVAVRAVEAAFRP